MFIAVVPFAAGPFLDVSVKGLDQVSAGAAIGSFFAVLALFAPPVTLLGMVAPFAIRLAIDDIRDAGSVAGRLYALSTVGSLLGTFLSALVTIPCSAPSGHCWEPQRSWRSRAQPFSGGAGSSWARPSWPCSRSRPEP